MRLELRRPDGRWLRSWHADGEPKARHDGLAADYACLVDAFTRLAEATGAARWIDEARSVADTLLGHFWDEDNGGLFTTPDDGEVLVARQKDLFDNATPSANSTAAVALTRLAALTGETRYAEQADQILRLVGAVVDQAPSAFSHALSAVALREHGITEVAVVGDRRDLVDVVTERWRPAVVLAWGEPYESPLWDGRVDGLAYVCQRLRLPGAPGHPGRPTRAAQLSPVERSETELRAAARRRSCPPRRWPRERPRNTSGRRAASPGRPRA